MEKICEKCKEEEAKFFMKGKWICPICWNRDKQPHTERRLKMNMTKTNTVKKASNTKSSIICVSCKEAKKVRPDVYDQRVKKFGSEEKLLAGYQCRDCRKKAK